MDFVEKKNTSQHARSDGNNILKYGEANVSKYNNFPTKRVREPIMCIFGFNNINIHHNIYEL